MEKLHFTVEIDAPVEKVWNTMLDDATYRDWTSVFHPSSYYEGKWETGAKMRFIGPEEDGSLSGMVSEIAEVRKHEFVSIHHLGILKNGVEDTTSDEVKKWGDAYEDYTFTDLGGKTRVEVDLDMADEYKEMFENMWPDALKRLKELAERS